MFWIFSSVWLPDADTLARLNPKAKGFEKNFRCGNSLVRVAFLPRCAPRYFPIKHLEIIAKRCAASLRFDA
jgi:hypothetical protein